MKTKPNILVVDNSPESLQDLTRILAQHDVRLLAARSAEEALTLVGSHPCALALVDAQMPGMGGLQFLESLRGADKTREIPVILMSESPEDCSRLAYEKGAVDCLAKPVDALVLSSKVRVFVKLYRQRREVLDAQRRLRAVMDAAPVGISFIDLDATRTQVSRNLTAQAQFESDTAPRFFAHGRELPLHEQPLQRAVDEDRTIPAEELEVVLASGRRWYAEVACAPLRDGADVLGGVQVTVDVGERKRLAQALQDSERHFRELADAVPQLVWTADLQGNVAYYNSRRTEYAPTEEHAPGFPCASLVHPDDAAKTARAWQTATSDGVRYECEHRLQMAGGSYRWHVSRALAVRDDAGERITWFGTATDVHTLKEAQAELSETKALLEAINQSTPVLVALKDRESRIRYANPAVVQSTGCPPERVLGHNDIDWFGPELGGVIVANDRKVMESGQSQVFEEQTSDDRIWLSTKTPWRGADGSIQGLIVVSHDYTERKRMQSTLQENEARLGRALEDSQRMMLTRDRLASLVSHDLRNPLATILMQAALLRRALAQGKLQQDRLGDSLERIERNGIKMDRLIDELLDVAQLQAGEPLQLVYDDVDLAQLVRQSMLDHQRSAPGHRLELVVKGPVMGRWDNGRLERVVDNLLSNAIKYSPQGGRVLLELETADGANGPVTLQVNDQGVGIAAADLPHIFEWYGRGKNTGAIRGSGIGLAGVKAIVEQHGGSISVQSEEGKGATFTVRLPRQAGAERDVGRTRFQAITRV